MLESDIRRGRALAEEGQRKMIRANARPMYGPESEHSFFADSALASLPVPDQKAQRRLLHDREAHAARAEKRAISTTTLGGLVPTTISPWVEGPSPTACAPAHRWRPRSSGCPFRRWA